MRYISTLVLIATLLFVITALSPASAQAGENDGPIKNGLTAYQLPPDDAGTVVFELWFHDESVVNVGNYDLMVNIDGVPTDIRIATVQDYDTCTQLAQRYRATVLVHPGQVRVSDVRIAGRKPYYIDRSVNLTFRIEGGQTQIVRQPVVESLLVSLEEGYGKVLVGDDVMINRAPPACSDRYRLGGYYGNGGLGIARADLAFVHRDTGLCSSVSVSTAPSRAASGHHVWVHPGEQVTILPPDEQTCTSTSSSYGLMTTTSTMTPCEVEWHGPAIAGHQHGLSCSSDERVICVTEGTGELVSQPECRKATRSSDNVGEFSDVVAYRITVGDQSVGRCARRVHLHGQHRHCCGSAHRRQLGRSTQVPREEEFRALLISTSLGTSSFSIFRHPMSDFLLS